MRKAIVIAAMAASLLVMAAPAMAQDSGDVVYRKHTVVDFGDDTIEGDLSKPDGAYLDSQKRQRHARLIKVRENFRPEILQSVTTL